jgi:hypothetical protein
MTITSIRKNANHKGPVPSNWDGVEIDGFLKAGAETGSLAIVTYNTPIVPNTTSGKNRIIVRESTVLSGRVTTTFADPPGCGHKWFRNSTGGEPNSGPARAGCKLAASRPATR